MRRVTRVLVAAAAAAAVLLTAAPVTAAAAAARRHQHEDKIVAGRDVAPTASTPHPEVTATPETLALWAKIRGELEARNYSRPASGEGVVGQLGAGTFGVDVSSWIGETTWSCIKGKGYSFGVVREFMESCAVDSNGVHTVANAWAAKLSHVDIYLFPSYGCGLSAAQQVDRTIDSMGQIPFGTLWLDIEAGGQKSASYNHAWMMAALAQGVHRIGASRMGIYSSRYEWGQVMGGLSGPTSYPLWYADYDGQTSFADFVPFAGWTHPHSKQFAGDAHICSADVDLNWY